MGQVGPEGLGPCLPCLPGRFSPVPGVCVGFYMCVRVGACAHLYMRMRVRVHVCVRVRVRVRMKCAYTCEYGWCVCALARVRVRCARYIKRTKDGRIALLAGVVCVCLWCVCVSLCPSLTCVYV